MQFSGAGKAMACRHRTLSLPRRLVSFFTIFSFHAKVSLLAAPNFAQIWRNFFVESLSVGIGEPFSKSTADSRRSNSLPGKNSPPPSLTDVEPLRMKDPLASSIVPAVSLFGHGVKLLSGDKPSNHSISYQQSWSARTLLPSVHHLDQPLLRFELLGNLWWLELLGPSVPAALPGKPKEAQGKTLIWYDVPFIGLRPRSRKFHQSPSSHYFKTKPFCSLSPLLKPINVRPPVQAQPASKPRSVFNLLANPLLWMSPFSSLAGQRRHHSRVATPLDRFASYLCRGLMSWSYRGPPEMLNFMKPFIRNTLVLEEPTHQTSLAAGENPGPPLALCLVRLSRAHDISFFWVISCFIEKVLNFSKTKFSHPVPVLLGDAPQPSRTLLTKSQWYALSCLSAILINPEFCCLYLNGWRLHSIASLSVIWLCFSFWRFKQPYSSMEILSLKTYARLVKQSSSAASSVKHLNVSSYASFARAIIDHIVIGEFAKPAFYLESLKVS